MISTFKWDEKYSVEHSLIDGQHKELFRLIADFYDKIYHKSNQEVISEVIKRLEDYVVLHFSSEEKLMEEANYDKLEEHKKLHREFMEKVSDFRKRHNEGRLLLSLEVSNFIKDWITKHIMETDQQYKTAISKIKANRFSDN